jgi:uncharacterized protein YukE
VVTVHVVVPQVELPQVELPTVRRMGGVLAAASDRFGVAAWRLGGSAAALAGGLAWCGPASSAYLGECGEQRAWLVNAWDALQRAGSTCRAYADEVEHAQLLARRATATARELVAERAQLVEQVRRIDTELVSAAADGPGEGHLFSTFGGYSTEISRLQAWADRLARDAASVRSTVDQVEETCRSADARAAAAFEQIAAMTLAARVESARAASPLPAESMPAEDGSAGSRVGGFLSALGEDVTQPLSMLAGLVGLNGGVADSWASLGQGLTRAASHPIEVGQGLVDWEDIDRGDWGHWIGTVGPGALASLGSAGGYTVLKSLSGFQMLERARTLADEIRRLGEFADSSAIARMVFANGGYDSSRLVAGGGLLAHEIAGGHSLERHVGLTIDQLRQRIAKFPKVYVASTFADRASAEHIVAEVLDARSGAITDWLAARPKNEDKGLELIQDMGRPVGLSVRGGRSVPMQTPYVKIVLIYDDSPLGFHILTAYPIR